MTLVMIMSKLFAPIAYQGGKNRIAEKILNRINPSDDSTFYDLCCGSGSISIELANRGFPVKNIYMLDKGPWGLFWRMIGDGTFDLNKFREIIDRIPKNSHEIKQYAELLSKQPADQDTVYVFLILQSCSFGGKAIWIENNTWKNCSFRNYWIPTETSNRRSPVNPMMPMPETLFKRVFYISRKMKSVNGYNMDIDNFIPNDGVVYKSVVYIDPPYNNTTCYGHDFDGIC
jgi:site-specific DNA-adenine methylase